MHKFFLNRDFSPALSCRILILTFGLFFQAQAQCFAHEKTPDYCSGGKPLRMLSMFYSQRIPGVRIGTPLDQAFATEREQVEKLRSEAETAFLTQPPPPLLFAMENYTFLTPKSAEDIFGLRDLLAMSEFSAALKYRSLLWRNFIERFTTVREAPSQDPGVLRFQVSLDLSYYCRYRQRIRDLVTQR